MSSIRSGIRTGASVYVHASHSARAVARHPGSLSMARLAASGALAYPCQLAMPLHMIERSKCMLTWEGRGLKFGHRLAPRAVSLAISCSSRARPSAPWVSRA